MSEGSALVEPVSASGLTGIACNLQDCFNYEIDDCPDTAYFVGSSTESNEAVVAFLQTGLESATNGKQLQETVFSVLSSQPKGDVCGCSSLSGI